MTQSPLSHHKDSHVSACILEETEHLGCTLDADSATLSVPMLGPLPGESAHSRGSGVFLEGDPVVYYHLSLPPLTIFSSLLSILPQAALEEIHRFSGTYTCMNTFKGRT
jgi:hypothetical protein